MDALAFELLFFGPPEEVTKEHMLAGNLVGEN